MGSHKRSTTELEKPSDTLSSVLTYLTLYIALHSTIANPYKTTPAHQIPASLTTKTPRIPLYEAVIFVVLQLSLRDHRAEGVGVGGWEECLGRIRPNQTLCADPSSPHIKDSRELSSARSAFHCSRLGIMRFGPRRSGCNYSFSTVVFPPDLETLWGQEWSST